MTYSFFSPIEIGNRTLKNRIIYPAQCRLLCTEDGFITDRFIEYYRNIARGGCAMIIPELGIVDNDWKLLGPMPGLRICDEKFLPGMKRVVDAVHAEDCLFLFQLWHPGICAPACPTPTINDLPTAHIHEIQKKYVAAAQLAKASGADGVEFHLAHNYLPQEFLTPYFNHRQDEYGAQTLENAMRFSLEIIDEIVRTCCANSDFLLAVKVNASDFLNSPRAVETGTTPERTVEICKILETHGANMLTVSAGGGLTSYPASFDTGRNPEGYKLPFAKMVKDAVSIPVVGIDTLRHPEFIDQAIRKGLCDIAAIGRGLVADPHWPRKVAEGREKEIRRCINCLYCFNGNPLEVSGCSVNPFSKREIIQPELVKNGGGRRVVIVGAGPAGLEAAVTLAEREFNPIVIDRRFCIGGLINTAIIPPYKNKLPNLLEYYTEQIGRLGIQLMLGQEADEELICSLDPYAVILATGTKEFTPPIPGIEHTHPVRRIIEEQPPLENGRVVILGGGSTGVEAAQIYLMKGNHAQVLEMRAFDPAGHIGNNIILGQAMDDGVEVHFETKIDHIEPNKVYATHLPTGDLLVFEADMIICSLGVRPDNDLYERLTGRFERLYNIGDSDKPGRIVNAVQAGADLAYALQ